MALQKTCYKKLTPVEEEIPKLLITEEEYKEEQLHRVPCDANGNPIRPNYRTYADVLKETNSNTGERYTPSEEEIKRCFQINLQRQTTEYNIIQLKEKNHIEPDLSLEPIELPPPSSLFFEN